VNRVHHLGGLLDHGHDGADRGISLAFADLHISSLTEPLADFLDVLHECRERGPGSLYGSGVTAS